MIRTICARCSPRLDPDDHLCQRVSVCVYEYVKAILFIDQIFDAIIYPKDLSICRAVEKIGENKRNKPRHTHN